MFSCGVMLGCWSPTWILSRVCWSLWGEVASAPNCVANVSLAPVATIVSLPTSPCPLAKPRPPLPPPPSPEPPAFPPLSPPLLALPLDIPTDFFC